MGPWNTMLLDAQPPRSRWGRFFSSLAAQRLLSACLVVFALVLFGHSILAVTLRVAADEFVPRALTTCAIRVNTFRRNDLLADFIAHYESCPAVEEIDVVWSDLDNVPPSWLVSRAQSRSAAAKVVVERHQVDTLNNRFKPLARPKSAAVFSVDDDISVTCEVLESMLAAWRSNPRQMVGLAPRLITQNPSGDYRYLRWWHVWWNGRYSLVLTKLAVFHRDYLAAYSRLNDPTMAAIREHVDRHRNCEDIAMSFIVANATDSAPIWLRGRYTDFGESFGSHAGISSGGDHLQIRADCIALFAKLFGRMPLSTASHKLVPADGQLFW